MTIAKQAKFLLAKRLEKGRMAADPTKTAEDLVTWFNCSCVTKADLERLAGLFETGKFSAWNCPTCNDRVYLATPEDWDHYQGALQADYVSYPGGSRRQCDFCRCNFPEPSFDEDE